MVGQRPHPKPESLTWKCGSIWGFPEIEVPLVLIHSGLGFSLLKHPAIGVPPFLGNPPDGDIYVQPQQPQAEGPGRTLEMFLHWKKKRAYRPGGSSKD